MKQKDIAAIIIIAALSGLVSFFISGKIFVTPANRQQQVEVVDKLTSDFGTPDPRFFNKDSINPTTNTQLGSTNSTPFNGTQQ